MRLKYPGSLSRLYCNASTTRTAFGFAFCTSAPVLIAGLGIFLPHGESVSTDIVARWGPRRPQVKTKTTDSLIKSALFCPRWPNARRAQSSMNYTSETSILMIICRVAVSLCLPNGEEKTLEKKVSFHSESLLFWWSFYWLPLFSL